MEESLLHNLENESVLLMYLAGELPEADKAEVEQLLSSDGMMRQTLEQLRQAKAEVYGMIAEIDQVQPLPIASAVAQRQVSRMIRQWNLHRQLAPKPAAAKKGLRYPWFVYPLATAASILIAFLVWWGNSSSPLIVDPHTRQGFALRGDSGQEPQPTTGSGDVAPEQASPPPPSMPMAAALFDDETEFDRMSQQATSLRSNADADRDLIFPEDASGSR